MPCARFETFVAGTPGPKGSKSFKGMRDLGDGRKAAILVESSKKEKPWSKRVTAALQGAGVYFGGAVVVEMEFRLQRPKSLGKRPTPCVNYPDTSKLVRSTEDAISAAGLWGDDAQVVRVVADKRYADAGEETGCLIRITDPFPEFVKTPIEAFLEKRNGQNEKRAAKRAAAGRPRGGATNGRARAAKAGLA